MAKRSLSSQMDYKCVDAGWEVCLPSRLSSRNQEFGRVTPTETMLTGSLIRAMPIRLVISPAARDVCAKLTQYPLERGFTGGNLLNLEARGTVQAKCRQPRNMPQEFNFLSQLTGSFSQSAAGNPTVAMIEAAYRHHGLDWRYINCEVTPEKLGDAIAQARSWLGSAQQILGPGDLNLDES
jgi:hypothetical protein